MALPPILIADDDRLARQLLERVLQREGFAVVSCSSGQEVLEKVAAVKPGLIVSDHEMPGLTGPQLCGILRRSDDPEVASVPIILLTGHTDAEHEVESLEAGANDFVTKPVNPAVLRARIATHLRLHALRLQLEEQNAELEEWRRTRELDLEAARITQRAILPPRLPRLPGWEVATHYQPLIQVGGDMYDWLKLPDGRWLFWVADATGHGASAALLTSLTKLMFSHAAQEYATPAEILCAVNAEFHATMSGKSFMTAACLAVAPEKGEVVFAGLGHPPLMIVRSSGEVESVPSQGPPLGIVAEQKCSETTLELASGEVALLYTDGLYSDERAGKDHLVPQDIAGQLPRAAKSAEEFVQQTVAATVKRSGEAGVGDDVAVLALRFAL